MVNIFLIIGLTALITAVAGGLGYLVWLKTRPKKEFWTAKVYRLSEGVRKGKDDKGKEVSLSLKDLIPYARDVLEKVDKKEGVYYHLKRLDKVTPAVEPDCVEKWGDVKEVSVLLVKGGCTILRKGFDVRTGESVFDPLPHSRINLIKGEMAFRKERLQKEKDVLQAITPWVVAGIVMFGLVAIGYLMVTGFVEMSEHFENAVLDSDKTLLALESMRQGVPSVGRQTVVEVDSGGDVT